MTITTLSGLVHHYTSVTFITDIVAILLKCVTGTEAMTVKKSMQTSEGKKMFQNKRGHRNGGILPMSTQHLCHCS